MLSSHLLQLDDRLYKTTCIEDLFGEEPSSAAIDENYRSLQTLLGGDTPDPAHQKIRAQLEASLAKHYNSAQKALSDGTYGERKPLTVTIRHSGNEFVLKRQVASSDVCKTYYGVTPQQGGETIPIIVRIAQGETPDELRANSRLLSEEAATLKALWQDSADPNLVHLPALKAQFVHNRAQVNILSYCPSHDFYHVRLSPHHRNGVESQHVAWILLRALTTLDYCHSLDIVHGNITPAHLIIYPTDHNVSLISWQHSTRVGNPYQLVSGDYAAPETQRPNIPALPASDIYSLGKSIIYLAGGDVASDTAPASLHRGLAAVLASMVLESPLQRPRARDLFKRIAEIRTRPHGFVEFPI